MTMKKPKPALAASVCWCTTVPDRLSLACPSPRRSNAAVMSGYRDQNKRRKGSRINWVSWSRLDLAVLTTSGICQVQSVWYLLRETLIYLIFAAEAQRTQRKTDKNE